MKTSQKAIDELIKPSEEVRLYAYKPVPDDPWTIGWGHTGGVKEGDRCSLEQAEAWLKDDLQGTEQTINQNVDIELTQNQFDALADLIHNIGSGNFLKSTLLKKLNAGEITEAADQFLRWKYKNGVVLRGLEKRRVRDRNWFLTGSIYA